MEAYRVGKRSKDLCAPANKNDEDPTAVSHQQGLLCYKARHRVRFPTLEPFINNQFVDQDVTTRRRFFHCQPPASTVTAIKPNTPELGSGTVWSTPKSPCDSSAGPAAK